MTPIARLGLYAALTLVAAGAADHAVGADAPPPAPSPLTAALSAATNPQAAPIAAPSAGPSSAAPAASPPVAQSPLQTPNSPPDQCGASDLAWLVGHLKTEIPVPVDPSHRRVLCTACPVGEGADPTRLTIEFDAETDVVQSVSCG